MAKIKTNKLARKKFRISASGRIKRRQANRSHNTAKKAAKVKRKLRMMIAVDDADRRSIQRMLPNG